MSITDILAGLKDKVLDAATYELLRRNYELLEENNDQLKDRVEFLKEEVQKLKGENLRLIEQNASLHAELDMLKQDENYIIYQGLAFKKDKDGKILPQPRCPKCYDLLSTVDNIVFICKPCNYTTSVFEHPVDIAKKLNEER
jgi:cell division protein FtsB